MPLLDLQSHVGDIKSGKSFDGLSSPSLSKPLTFFSFRQYPKGAKALRKASVARLLLLRQMS